MALHLRQSLRSRLAARWSQLLDWAISPVTRRLTADEYYACRPRGDCFRTLARRYA